MARGWTYLTLRENSKLREKLSRICLSKAIADGINLDTVKDVLLVGSRSFPQFLHRYVSDFSDADIVVLCKHIPFSERKYRTFIFEDVKCVQQYRIDNAKWFGYDMPYYSLLYDLYYCPEDLSGVWYQFWRKKLMSESSIPVPYAYCSICKAKVSFTSDDPTFIRIIANGAYHGHHHLFLCKSCASFIAQVLKLEFNESFVSSKESADG